MVAVLRTGKNQSIVTEVLARREPTPCSICIALRSRQPTTLRVSVNWGEVLSSGLRRKRALSLR